MEEMAKSIGRLFLFFMLFIVYLIHWGVMAVSVRVVKPMMVSSLGSSPSWKDPGNLNTTWNTALTDAGFKDWEDAKFWNKA